MSNENITPKEVHQFDTDPEPSRTEKIAKKWRSFSDKPWFNPINSTGLFFWMILSTIFGVFNKLFRSFYDVILMSLVIIIFVLVILDYKQDANTNSLVTTNNEILNKLECQMVRLMIQDGIANP